MEVYIIKLKVLYLLNDRQRYEDACKVRKKHDVKRKPLKPTLARNSLNIYIVPIKEYSVI